MVCLPAAGGGTSFSTERVCPGGSSCKEGVCVPSSSPCSGTCGGTQVCTAFVDPSGPGKLATYCSSPVGIKAGGQTCSKDAECQSGICLLRARGAICYRACKEKDCAIPGWKCQELTVTVNGVQGQVQGCVPAS